MGKIDFQRIKTPFLKVATHRKETTEREAVPVRIKTTVVQLGVLLF